MTLEILLTRLELFLRSLPNLHKNLIKMGLTLLVVATFTAIKLLLLINLGDGYLSFLGIFSAIVITGLFFGWSFTLLTTALSMAATLYFFTPPTVDLFANGGTMLLKLMLFVLEMLVVGYALSRLKVMRHLFAGVSQELTKSNQRFELLTSSAQGFAIFFVNQKGLIEDWNQSAQRLFGLSKEEVMLQPLSKLFRDEDSEWQQRLKQAQRRATYETEVQLQLTPRRSIWLSYVLTPLYNDDQKLMGFGVVCRDRSDRKALERQRDEFVNDASHELKTPLTSLKLLTQVMSKELNHLKPETQNIALKIDNQLNTLTRLVNMMLDVSRIQVGTLKLNLELFDPQQLLVESLPPIQPALNVKTIKIHNHSSDQILADKVRLQSVIQTVIKYAAYWVGPNHVLHLETVSDGKTWQLITCDLRNRQLLKQQKKLFSSSANVKNSLNNTSTDLGLNLFLSAKLIKLHGGKISFEADEKGVVSLSISLPLTPS